MWFLRDHEAELPLEFTGQGIYRSLLDSGESSDPGEAMALPFCRLSDRHCQQAVNAL